MIILLPSSSRKYEYPFSRNIRPFDPAKALPRHRPGLAYDSRNNLERTRITCPQSVAAIIQLVQDGFGVAAILNLFVSSNYIEAL